MRTLIGMVGLLVAVGAFGCAQSTSTASADAGVSGRSTYYPAAVATASESTAACTATGACAGGATADAGGVATDGCTQTFDTFVLSPQCAQAMETADCADLQKALPSFWDKCLPPCTTVTHHCNGNDSVTICEATMDAATNMRAATMRCSSVCRLGGRTYAGTCGLTYQGQTSSKGHDVCWCQ